jgi:hypothetical protein
VITDRRLEEFANEIGERHLRFFSETRERRVQFRRYTGIDLLRAPTLHSSCHDSAPSSAADGINTRWSGMQTNAIVKLGGTRLGMQTNEGALSDKLGRACRPNWVGHAVQGFYFSGVH